MTEGLSVVTEHPIALDSPDHITPWGTKNDNSRNAEFVRKLIALVDGDVSLLDLGCSGGGLVRDMLVAGCLAVGIEGSDYSLKRQRAEWATIPENLFTADISKPFSVKRYGQPIRFQVITAWEVMEHFAEADLATVFANIDHHLAPGGLVIGTVSAAGDATSGMELHQTIQGQRWWWRQFREHGFVYDCWIERYFGGDMVRNEPASFPMFLHRLADTPKVHEMLLVNPEVPNADCAGDRQRGA